MHTNANNEELRHAIERWNRLDATLDVRHRKAIDRLALGEDLKSVCFDLGLRYDNVQKRIRRAQLRLDLASTALFLHVWVTVRRLGSDAVSPVMLRYANEIANQSAPAGECDV